jgi:hypothetical protein
LNYPTRLFDGSLRRNRDGKRSASKGINITNQIRLSPASKGVKHCKYEAIFDANFRLESDYLRRAIPFLVHNPQIALVQGPISNLRRPKGEDLLDLLLCQTQDPPDPTRSPASPLSDPSQDPTDPQRLASPLVSPLLLDSTRSSAFPGRPPVPNTKEE